MEDRITLHLLYVALASALIAMVLTGVALYSSFLKQCESELLQTAQKIAVTCEKGDASDVCSLYTTYGTDDTHIQLVGEEGVILYDSDNQSAVSASDSVLSQPEVDQALQNGSDSDRRRSEETGQSTIYCAVRLDSGSVLLLSQPASQMVSFFSGSFGSIIIIFLILIPLSFLFSLLLTRQVIRPIKKLPDLLSKPNFDPDKAGVYPELVPLLQEITERRNERESMRQEFTANVSHELKTPLTTISGYSEMIASGIAKPEDVARFAEKIHAESERMQTLVGDIIELNALDSEKVHQHDEQVNILTLVQSCTEQLSPHFSAKHLSVYVTGDGFVVPGNQRQLWELVYNLLDNARRYNVDGGMIRITVSDHTLTVQDTGIGIAKEHQGRVFERFYRVDKSHSRATGGTGLGLSIVKHVAELHGAMVELESTEHIGTTIRVVFPQ